MKHLKHFGMLAAVALFSVVLAKADDYDKKTIITTTEPLALPTVTLQPGTYVFMLDRGGDVNRHIVRVWDQDQQHLITTIFATPDYKVRQTGDTKLTFWETPAGEPKALRSWFWPGDNWGQEFMYPKETAERLSASNSKAQVPTTEEQPKNEPAATTSSASASSNTATAAPTQSQEAAVTPAPAPAPVTQPVEVAQAQPPATPAQTPAPAPQPAAASTSTTTTAANQTPDTLPQTGSDLPLIGMIGLVSLAAFAGTGLQFGRAKR
jgi:hypothetical protein